MNIATQSELESLRHVDLNWAVKLTDVWNDALGDVPELHGKIRNEFSQQLDVMTKNSINAPLGWMVVGSGGVGKTHLLGAMRRECTRQGAGFVLVDMTDVRDFWDVVLQGYIDSLQSPFGDQYEYQYEQLLFQFFDSFSAKDQTRKNLDRLTRLGPERLAKNALDIIKYLRKKHGKQVIAFQDSVRALICLNSEDPEIESAGYSWLQGQEIDSDLKDKLGFQRTQLRPMEIVKSLSWLMSLTGPTVVAFDQLDPIVQQVKHYSLEDENDSIQASTARGIVEEIGAGLGAMRDITHNTLVVVSCVEQTLELLKDYVFSTYLDRFEATPRTLKRPDTTQAYENLLRQRLTPVYSEAGIEPPYPTWPFSAQAIADAQNESAREFLKLCSLHRERCFKANEIIELTEFKQVHEEVSNGADHPADFDKLDQLFAQFQSESQSEVLLEEKSDDTVLAPRYQLAMECLITEHREETPMHIDAFVESDFSGGKNQPLHARLRVVDQQNDSSEFHYCLRALQRTHHSAFRTRLKASMTQSGIDKSLSFRKLMILRSSPLPGGAKTAEMTQQFSNAGGLFHEPDGQELAIIDAVYELSKLNDPLFEEWLKNRQPISGTDFAQKLKVNFSGNQPVPEPMAETPVALETDANETHSAVVETAPDVEQVNETITVDAVVEEPVSEETADEDQGVETPTGEITFGTVSSALNGDQIVSMPLKLMKKHTIILGGSGSGKSVTVRRVIEEAALEGIPSIVIDCANDMCEFNQKWDASPSSWRAGDEARAKRFHAQAEQIVWTPGSTSSGNPLVLQPLPDFSSFVDDEEERADAVGMAYDGLRETAIHGNSQKAKNSAGILQNALDYFSKHHPAGGIDQLITLLEEYPLEMSIGITNEEKYAKEMADSLKLAQISNPLLKDTGTPLDPTILFGDDAATSKTRISVISLVKLNSKEKMHSFMNQLAMKLFSWIKKNPTPPNNRAMRGLLVIDEARDFAPSGKGTECKESLVRLAAQARKYGLGLVFATQHPKDIDTKIVGNCATHLYGLNNSPASKATLDELMKDKGGNGSDIAKLKAGQFFVSNNDSKHRKPTKTVVPMSLSRSPEQPAEEDYVMGLASQSSQQLGLS